MIHLGPEFCKNSGLWVLNGKILVSRWQMMHSKIIYYRVLVASVHQLCLKHALRCHKPGTDHIPKLVLSLIIHLSKDEDRLRVTSTLENAFTCALPSLTETSFGRYTAIHSHLRCGNRIFKRGEHCVPHGRVLLYLNGNIFSHSLASVAIWWKALQSKEMGGSRRMVSRRQP